jgi:hypothetical protein
LIIDLWPDKHADNSMMFDKIGDSGEPYEQRWVMRSVRGSPLVGAVVTTAYCA